MILTWRLTSIYEKPSTISPVQFIAAIVLIIRNFVACFDLIEHKISQRNGSGETNIFTNAHCAPQINRFKLWQFSASISNHQLFSTKFISNLILLYVNLFLIHHFKVDNRNSVFELTFSLTFSIWKIIIKFIYTLNLIIESIEQ